MECRPVWAISRLTFLLEATMNSENSSEATPQEWRQAAKFGALTMVALAGPIIVLFELGVRSMKYVTSQMPAGDGSLEMAFLIGIITASLMALAVHYVLRTRAVYWFVYFESYLATLGYPREERQDG